MKYRFPNLRSRIKIYNGAEAFLAALFSLTATAFTIWLVKPFFYDRAPVYGELAAGGTIWNGYYKQGDMYVFYLLLLLIPLFAGLFLFVLHTVKSPAALKKDMGEGSRNTEDSEKNSREYRQHQALPVFVKCFALLFLCMASLTALQNTAAVFLPGHGQELQRKVFMITVLFVAVVLGMIFKDLIKKKDIAVLTGEILRFLQLFPAFGLLGYYRFFYEYQGAQDRIQLYYSAKWKLFCLVVFLGFFLCQLIQIRKKKPGIYLSTLMLVAINSVAATPEGILSVDFFHNGEMAFPMQQLVSFGKVPYFDIDPIHGFCDFFYSLMNVVFFDGTYMSQSAAIMAAELFMAAFLALVMGKCIGNRYASLITVCLLMPYLVQKAGVRYLVFFAAFFILFNREIRKDGRRFLWWWVILCILGISWNVSIGSAMAVAFLPEVIYRLIKNIIPKLKNMKAWSSMEKKRFGISYGVLVLVGISYIPLFLQILRFLGENAGTTLYVNGTPVFGEDFHFIRTFGISVPYLWALIYALKGSRRGKSAFISMFSCLAVIGNYACVRYDEGARLAVLAVFFGMLFILTVTDNRVLNNKDAWMRKYERYLQWGGSALCCIHIFYLAWDYLPGNNGNTMFPQIVEEELEITIMDEKTKDPVVYVSGDSVGMPALGTGFIQGSTLNSLKNILTVLETEENGQGYVDLTNRISHYVIFNKESILPYTSAYNISNKKMQEKAIASINEERPETILIAPLIQFDLAPFSIRSMEFYTALIKMGYRPYVYEDVVYLKDGEALLLGAADGKRSLGLICHKEYLGMLPFIWGNSMAADENQFNLERIELTYECIREENETALRVETDSMNGMDISYIALKIKEDGIKKKQWEFSFYSETDNEVHSFGILSGMDKAEEIVTYLIPVGSSPFWQFSGIDGFWLDGVAELEAVEFYR